MKFVQLAALAALALSLAACSSFGDSTQLNTSSLIAAPSAPAPAPFIQTPRKKPLAAMSREAARIQCVQYVREHSPVAIRGNAGTWWDQAAGRYRRSAMPREDAVMVMGGTRSGHVAIVRQIVDAREIRIDHANWLNDGAIYVSNPVKDVSADNDWSQVKVWNIETGTWGVKTYSVKGFVGPEPANDRVASLENLIN
jgi:surface antigen